MTKIYVNGCSFSHGHKDFGHNDAPPGWVWPSLVNEICPVINEARLGSSNHRILRRSTEFLESISDPKDWVFVVQLSNIERQEFYYDNFQFWIGRVNQHMVLDDRASNSKYLTHETNDKLLKLVEHDLNYTALVHTSLLEKAYRLLQNITAFEYFCKIKGVDRVLYTSLGMSSSLKYWFEPLPVSKQSIIPGEEYKDHKLYKDCCRLYKMLNISDRILQPISHIARGYEESNEDGHPNQKGHTMFYRYIINEFKLRNYI